MDQPSRPGDTASKVRGVNYYCPMCGMGALRWPLQWFWSNHAGDELLGCRICGYETVYRIRTGQCEPRPGSPSEGWLPPLGWSPPRRSDPAGPPAENSTPPAGAELGTEAHAATFTETAENHEDRRACEGLGAKVAQPTQSFAPNNAATECATDEIDREPNAPTNVEEMRTEPTPTRAQAHHLMALDQEYGIDADEARRDGQDRPRGQAGQTIAFVRQILEDAEALRANPDLDPVRKGRALTQFARQAIDMLEQNRRLDVQTRWQAISAMQQMLHEEREKLRANPDLDPLQRTRALAELMREDRRAIEAYDRLVAQANRDFDLVTVLEEALKEAQPEIDRRRRQLLSDPGDAEGAEMSANEPDGPAPKPS
jgi:hypothetical protein